MQNPFKPNLRRPWILLCTTLLVVYTIMPGEHATLFYYEAPSALIEALMFILAFPLGALAFLNHSPWFTSTERFIFWAIAMGLGYAQWFHIFPALLRSARQRRTTTLNLSGGESVALPTRTPLGLSSAETKPLTEAQRQPTPHFNERGLTPLERILRDDSER
jgi:hypothetical protein